MAYLFDRRFKLGCAIGVAAFLLANGVSYWNSYVQHQEFLVKMAGWSEIGAMRWGWPFDWEVSSLSFAEGGILNLFVAIVFALTAGFVIRIFAKSR